MILEIDGGGERRTVEVKGPGTFLVDGREMECDWIRLPDGCYSLILNGRVYDISADLDTSECLVTDRSGTRRLRLSDPRKAAGGNLANDGQSGLQRICAEMPGKVIRLLVARGESVRYDQSLIVIEAMKMQNEIRSPKSGVVVEVAVEAGRAVKSGDFLISIE